ncbi:MAG: hypothetical protein EWV75_01660 [Microcystis wesenbergii Mw_QC_S_20081001_S30D]|uniref:Uncharacterized protein n=1 Tax=Microcystis wesenbergii Mw_QC_S_20081001_S30D TaxID=2486245 RepID=A0A552JZJ7_9CHRO|nr:MAG: hypothetical protein EWV73_20825 [Microcystis wesenbergii Mw_QC_B_20070930_S4D]TRU98965.1 MAG: hypothetical protein EWV74_14880 [Microcystis wesenbergii Mw_QC_S_20081001_S30]TRV01174.1 MAG: hypothetical protein EWV75_01660 [Microcystis wesenbergii Mw_QC_S_20081001_S30D]TRV12000.1 MAG: hypothetical protein EWV89_13890 [Microcystis wesenbergii Mw_QC_B_20070930_S4]
MKKFSPPQMKEVSFPIHPLSSQEIIFIYSPRSHLPRSPLPTLLYLLNRIWCYGTFLSHQKLIMQEV